MQRKIIHDHNQTYITDYFKVLDEIEILAKQNEKLSKLLKESSSNKYFDTGGHIWFNPNIEANINKC